MKMLAYSPSVEAYVKLEDGRIIDISRDIVGGGVDRITDGASTADFTLSNKGNKYHNLFKPMDRIVVFATRLFRLQLFSGYLDDVPFMATWNNEVTITASDTIKRLQNLYWDATMLESSSLYSDQGNSDFAKEDDGGMSIGAIRILTEVAKWPKDQIFVTDIPKAFLEWATDVYDTQNASDDAAAQKEQWKKWLGEGIVMDGSNQGSGSPTSIPSDLRPIVEKVAKEKGLDVALVCAIIKKESGWGVDAKNVANSNGTGDYGLMQVNTCHTNLKNFFPPAEGWRNPETNMRAGCAILKGALGHENGDIYRALRYYNGGGNGNNIGATIPYAKSVMGFYEDYKREIQNTGGTDSTMNPRDKAMSGGGAPAPKSTSAPLGTETKPPMTAGKSGTAGTSGTGQQGLQKSFSDTLNRMFADAKAAGFHIGVYSGWRSYKRQEELFATSRPGYAAHPGHSNHGWGTAADLEYSPKAAATAWAHKNAGKYGLVFRLLTGSPFEPWHIEPQDVKKCYEGGAVGSSGESGGESVQGSDVSGAGVSALAAAFWIKEQAPFETIESTEFIGKRAYINDEPVWNKVKELFNASMRTVSTAPNGSLIAWFPDKFGIHNRTPYFQIEDIEIKDVKINLSDAPMKTHVYVTGSAVIGAPVGIEDWLETNGIVSIEQEGIIQSVMNIPKGQEKYYTPEYIYKRYGLRPMAIPEPTVNNATMFPFFLALRTFMEQWTKQYKVSASFTFLPELFPGGRVRFNRGDGRKIEMYVESVRHRFSYKGGFSTDANLSCPTESNGTAMSGGL